MILPIQNPAQPKKLLFVMSNEKLPHWTGSQTDPPHVKPCPETESMLLMTPAEPVMLQEINTGTYIQTGLALDVVPSR